MRAGVARFVEGLGDTSGGRVREMGRCRATRMSIDDAARVRSSC